MMSREAAIETARQFAKTFTNRLVLHASLLYDIQEGAINPKIRINTTPRFKMSRGGAYDNRPFMSLTIANLIPSIQKGASCSDKHNFNEYNHIKDSSTIGNLIGISWQRHLAALIAHEFAHVIQFCGVSQRAVAAKLNIPISAVQEATHGFGWQAIYRDLRVKFVNGAAFREVILTPVKEVAPRANKTKRVAPTRSFVASRRGAGKGEIITYFANDKKIIGQLYVRKGYYISYFDPIKKVWIDTRFSSVVEARREIFEI